LTNHHSLGSRGATASRFLLCLLSAVLLAGCGGGDDEADQRRALEQLSKENAPAKLSEEVLDSLRVMKERFRITRDEYWDEKGGVLANEYFELWYPPGQVTVTHGMHAFGQLEAARKRFYRFFNDAAADRLTVICTESMPDFNDQTGVEWHVYSKIDGDKIYYQPIYILAQRQLGEVGVQRGYQEWAIDKISGGRSPRWLTQGLASLMSDEEWFLENQLTEFPDAEIKITLDQIDNGLKKKNDRMEYRIALYNAYRMVKRLAAKHGQEKLAGVVKSMGGGDDAKKSFEKVYGRPYKNVVAEAMDFKVGP